MSSYRGIVLDMDLSVSPTHGEQEMSVWNGHYACTCYHPLFTGADKVFPEELLVLAYALGGIAVDGCK